MKGSFMTLNAKKGSFIAPGDRSASRPMAGGFLGHDRTNTRTGQDLLI